MTVIRIVTNIKATEPADAQRFYGDILGLDLVMDQGWIRTYAAKSTALPQISFAGEGGSGTELPELSIEVDNLPEVHRQMSEGGFDIFYGPVDEPWGVRRFYVRDPFGKTVNILQHDT